MASHFHALRDHRVCACFHRCPCFRNSRCRRKPKIPRRFISETNAAGYNPMIDEITRGLTASNVSHCAAKSGNFASPASAGTACPHFAKNSRTRSSPPKSRTGGGSGVQRLIWNFPWLCLRKSAHQVSISPGVISNAPHPPSPPAFATAAESDGAQAPAIGAISIGI